MKFRFLLFTILLSSSCLSQELKEKRESCNYYEEIFFVDKNSKVKQGHYFKILKKTKDTLVQGAFENDIKVGIWKFYKGDNKLYLQYDYDNKKLGYVDEEISKIDSFNVFKENDFGIHKVDSPPLYIGFKDEIKHVLRNNIRATAEIYNYKISGVSLVRFDINKKGQLTNIKVENFIHESFKKEILRCINLIKGDWKPAKVNGVVVDSRIYIIFDLQFVNDFNKKYKSPFKTKPHLYVVNIFLSTK